jgi:bloom syndrome protein
VRLKKYDPSNEMANFIASEADDDEPAFEPRRKVHRSFREDTPGDGRGPPITRDERMADLPDIHRVMIDQFVDAAKKMEEKIRKSNRCKKALLHGSQLQGYGNLVDVGSG